MQADGELMHAVAGMHIFKAITPEQVQSRRVPHAHNHALPIPLLSSILQVLKFRKEIEEAAMVVVDGNISVETMRALVTTCAASDTEGLPSSPPSFPQTVLSCASLAHH